MANTANDSTVSVLSEEVVAESPTATVIPMTQAASPPTPTIVAAPVKASTVPPPTPTPTAAPPNKLLPVFQVIAAILAARFLSLLLVLLDAGVAVVAIVAPTNERLIGMSIVFVFSLAAFWLIGRSEPTRSVPK